MSKGEIELEARRRLKDMEGRGERIRDSGALLRSLREQIRVDEELQADHAAEAQRRKIESVRRFVRTRMALSDNQTFEAEVAGIELRDAEFAAMARAAWAEAKRAA